MILADPFREITPPDNLMSCAYSWHGNKLSEFREFVRELPRGVVRGKGFVADGAKTYLFSMVMGRDPSFEQFGSEVQPDLIGKVVLIFPPDIEESISQAVSGWSSRLEALKADPGGAEGATASGVPTDIAAQL